MSKYKEGDKVRVIDNTKDHGFKTGEVITLIVQSEDDGSWYAKNKDYWYVSELDIEPIDAPKQLPPQIKQFIKEASASYSQPADCLDGGDQLLTIKSLDGGGGNFFVIETERWAFDSVEELVQVLEHFKSKL